MGVVGPSEAPQGCASCHFLGTCSSSRRPAGGGARPVLGGSSSPSPATPGEAPGNAARLRCGGAARVPSHPVRAALSGLPAQACRAGGHQVLVQREQRLPSSAPGPGATPGPSPVWALAGGKGMAARDRPAIPELWSPGDPGPQFFHLLKEGDDPTSQCCCEH